MTEHLTRHGIEHDEDFTGGEDVREADTAGVPGEHADFREPGADETYDGDRDGDRDGDQNLSTADLASASAQPAAEDTHADAAPAKSGGDVESPPLIDEDKVTGFRDRWQNIQTGFVDDPQQSVREADELVAAVISALATTFAEHKGELEGQWRHGEPATEDLRVALRRYRSFFDQLLPR
jgi:hypothetical protein